MMTDTTLVDVVVPKWGMAMIEATIVGVMVAPGERVNEGAVLFEVETEKVTQEIPSPVAGEVAEILVDVDDDVEVGAVVMRIRPEAETGKPAGTPRPAESAEPRPETASIPEAQPTGGAPVEVEAAAPALGSSVPASAVRRRIARRLQASLAERARVTLTSRADVTRLVARLDELAEVGYTAAVIAVTARQIGQHPLIIGQWNEGNRIDIPASIDIGVAVDTPSGLMVPVIRGADAQTALEIQQALEVLVERANQNDLAVADFGGAFTISNLGAYHIDAFTPIMNPPETAILGLGRVRAEPVVLADEIAIRKIMTLSLAFDHRVIDGAPAAAFLNQVREALEQGDLS